MAYSKVGRRVGHPACRGESRRVDLVVRGLGVSWSLSTVPERRVRRRGLMARGGNLRDVDETEACRSGVWGGATMGGTANAVRLSSGGRSHGQVCPWLL